MRVVATGRGPWRVGIPADDRGIVALLVLGGLLVRHTTNTWAHSAELLGPGDVLRPWQAAPDDEPARWRIIEPARLAILDRRFVRATAAWPGVTEALIERSVTRSRTLAMQHAACSLPRLDERIPALLTVFAARWGTQVREGLHLPLPIDHTTIAAVAGARRPSVSVSMGRLRRSGRLRRLDDGSWLIAT